MMMLLAKTWSRFSFLNDNYIKYFFLLIITRLIELEEQNTYCNNDEDEDGDGD